MSNPRPVFKGSTYLVSRRCTQRQFLLRPSRVVDDVMKYGVAVAAQKYGVRIHAIVVMSNHYHLVATDPDGNLPDFERWLNSIVARALNASYGRWENFWATEQPSNVRLLNPDDVLAKMVYTACNPVAAGLVSHGEKWPGVRLFTPGTRLIRRPRVFFREEGGLPEMAALEIIAPPMGESSHRAIRAVLEGVAAKEAEIRAAVRAEGRAFVGAARVQAQSIAESPTTREPRRQMSPRVACRGKWQRIEALQRCRKFISDYRAALVAWMSRAADVLFPEGTFMMARRFALAVAHPD